MSDEKLSDWQKAILTLNHEVGQIWGELRWIKLILIGSFLIAILDLIKSIL